MTRSLEDMTKIFWSAAYFARRSREYRTEHAIAALTHVSAFAGPPLQKRAGELLRKLHEQLASA